MAKMPKRNAVAAGAVDAEHSGHAYVVFEQEAALEAALALNMTEVGWVKRWGWVRRQQRVRWGARGQWLASAAEAGGRASGPPGAAHRPPAALPRLPRPPQWNGRHLRVDRAAPRAAKGAVQFDPARSLFVGNLAHTAEVRARGLHCLHALRSIHQPTSQPLANPPIGSIQTPTPPAPSPTLPSGRGADPPLWGRRRGGGGAPGAGPAQRRRQGRGLCAVPHAGGRCGVGQLSCQGLARGVGCLRGLDRTFGKVSQQRRLPAHTHPLPLPGWLRRRRRVRPSRACRAGCWAAASCAWTECSAAWAAARTPRRPGSRASRRQVAGTARAARPASRSSARRAASGPRWRRASRAPAWQPRAACRSSRREACLYPLNHL